MNLAHSIGLLLPMLFSVSAGAVVPPGASGAWYNPEKSGHGLSVHIFASEHALVTWHSFDLSGNPLTLYMDGPITDRTFEATVYAPRGMRFGEFDPADLEMPVWGEIEIEFSSCDSAEMRWRALDPNYGDGSTTLRKLVGVSGLECSFDRQETAAFDTSIDRDFYPDGAGYAAIDEHGRFWGLETISGFEPDAIPLGGFIGFPGVLVRAEAGSGSTADVQRFSMAPWLIQPSEVLSAQWSLDARGGELSVALANQSNEVWRLTPALNGLVQPLTMGALVGEWKVQGRRQFFGELVPLRIEPDGRVCYDLLAPCRFSGSVSVDQAQSGFFDFQITDTASPTSASFSGRGWIQGGGASRRLVFVGDDGQSAFGLIAR